MHILIAILLFALPALARPQRAPTAVIDSGVIVGVSTAVPSARCTVDKYLGIPFAQSPPERFSPPKKPARWGLKALKTQAWKPACIQQFNYPEATRNFTIAVFNNPPPPESEDCLYLNVYAPSTRPPRGGRAVMFWLYGGSLAFGNAGQPAYDGAFLAGLSDVVVVTANYRTGAFGFPGAPALPPAARNPGFLDQRAALDWVRRNARALGGDPRRVTVFGESAGALSVDALVTSSGPEKGPAPFRAAIMMSGQASFGRPRGGAPGAAWAALVGELGCAGADEVACVRGAEALRIKELNERAARAFSPVVDNVTFVADPRGERERGNVARVPVLEGTTAEEGRVFAVGQNDLDVYLPLVTGNNAEFAEVVRRAYPVAEGRTDYDVISEIITELTFQCPAALHTTASARLGVPTYRYFYNASFPNLQRFPNAGVYHASEIAIVFGTYPKADATPQQVALSNFVRDAFANFAKDPVRGPGWGRADAEGEVTLGVLGNVGSRVGGTGVTEVQSGGIDRRCAVWAPLIGG